jgi:hypothetical protein
MIVIRSFNVHFGIILPKTSRKYEHKLIYYSKRTLEILFIFAYNERAKVGNEH